MGGDGGHRSRARPYGEPPKRIFGHLKISFALIEIDMSGI
jgi:hypothetical protein